MPDAVLDAVLLGAELPILRTRIRARSRSFSSATYADSASASARMTATDVSTCTYSCRTTRRRRTRRCSTSAATTDSRTARISKRSSDGISTSSNRSCAAAARWSGRSGTEPIRATTASTRSRTSTTTWPCVQKRLRAWVRETAAVLDYLGAAPEFSDKVAWLGLSYGAMSPMSMTYHFPSRFGAAILMSGGDLIAEPWQVTFYRRLQVPVLMLNGRYDPIVTKGQAQRFYDGIGTPAEDKRLVLYETGHWPLPRNETAREISDWLDRYLGPVEHDAIRRLTADVRSQARSLARSLRITAAVGRTAMAPLREAVPTTPGRARARAKPPTTRPARARCDSRPNARVAAPVCVPSTPPKRSASALICASNAARDAIGWLCRLPRAASCDSRGRVFQYASDSASVAGSTTPELHSLASECDPNRTSRSHARGLRAGDPLRCRDSCRTSARRAPCRHRGTTRCARADGRARRACRPPSHRDSARRSTAPRSASAAAGRTDRPATDRPATDRAVCLRTYRVSPRRQTTASFQYGARSARLLILPIVLRPTDSTMSTLRGHL